MHLNTQQQIITQSLIIIVLRLRLLYVSSDHFSIIWYNQFNSKTLPRSSIHLISSASNTNCLWLKQCRLMNSFCFAKGRQYKPRSTSLPSSRPDVPSSSAHNFVQQKQLQNNGSSGETQWWFAPEFWTGSSSLPKLLVYMLLTSEMLQHRVWGPSKDPWRQYPKQREEYLNK